MKNTILKEFMEYEKQDKMTKPEVQNPEENKEGNKEEKEAIEVLEEIVDEEDVLDEIEDSMDTEKLPYKLFLNTYTPAKIEEMLSEYVLGQPELLKAVADFLYYHMLRKVHPELPVRNLLIAGSSGTGKTEVFRCVKKLFSSININIADGSRVTKEGWSGNYKLKNILSTDLDILVLDETDKMCKPCYTSGGNNASEEIQSEFLKLLEGEYEYGKPKIWDDDEKTPLSIVFIGAFEGIREKKKNAVEMRTIGFGADYVSVKKATHEISDEDLIDFGMMPELVGRIASKVTTNDLSNEDYLTILKSPHSRLSSLINVLNQYDVDVDDVLEKDKIIDLIEKSKANRTGFRWVSAQVESMILNAIHEQGVKQNL